MEVDRKANVKEIDKDIKNKFRWDWLEARDDDGHYLSDYIRKLDTPGQAKCIICNDIIKYASSGKKAVVGHGNSKNHKQIRNDRDSSESLSSLFKSTADKNLVSPPVLQVISHS